jgi:hypothetical protein
MEVDGAPSAERAVDGTEAAAPEVGAVAVAAFEALIPKRLQSVRARPCVYGENVKGSTVRGCACTGEHAPGGEAATQLLGPRRRLGCLVGVPLLTPQRRRPPLPPRQDLNPLLALVHRRCTDPKAAVRKGALQLLVEAVTMRAGWQGYPRQLPSEQDLALLEAATMDPLVGGAWAGDVSVGRARARLCRCMQIKAAVAAADELCLQAPCLSRQSPATPFCTSRPTLPAGFAPRSHADTHLRCAPGPTRRATRPQVSVRKAALVALSRLSELLPLEPALCAAWVRSALPLVRDPESGIHEAVLEWAQFLLLDRAAAVAGAPARGPRGARARGGAGGDPMAADGEPCTPAAGSQGEGEEEEEEDTPPAAVAAAELRPLLAAVSSAGRAAGACMGKVCAALAAKKKLSGKKIAKGVEAFVEGVPSGSAEALGAWMLLKEVAGQDATAPSWQFLQHRWAALQAAAAAAHHSEDAENVREAEGGFGPEPRGVAPLGARTLTRAGSVAFRPRDGRTLHPASAWPRGWLRGCLPPLSRRAPLLRAFVPPPRTPPAPTWRWQRRAHYCCL